MAAPIGVKASAPTPEPFGKAERREQRKQQDGGLQEQRGAVDDDRSFDRPADPGEPRRGDSVRDRAEGQRAHRSNETDEGDADVRGIPGRPGQERFDEHAEHGRTEDDEDRKQRDVVQRRRREGRGQRGAHLVLPSAAPTTGAGSLTWIEVRIVVTAGVTMSSTGLG